MSSRQTSSPPTSSAPDDGGDGSPRGRSASPGRQEGADVTGSTRERILAAAERLFAEHGFSGVSMPMIAKASRITAGAIYKHFDSKADLFFEVVRRTVRAIPPPVAADGGTSDAALLPRIAAMYTTPALRLLRQLAVETHYASGRDPRVGELLRQSLDVTIRKISDTVAGAQQAGDLDPALDPTLTANAVMAVIMGLMHMETVAPTLVGDPKWRDFVQDRVAALMGLL